MQHNNYCYVYIVIYEDVYYNFVSVFGLARPRVVRRRKDWSIFTFIIILKKSTRSKICDMIIFSFLLAFHWSPEWKVIIEHKRSTTLFAIWYRRDAFCVSLKWWKIFSPRGKSELLYLCCITYFTCFSHKTESWLKRRHRVKNDKKVRQKISRGYMLKFV